MVRTTTSDVRIINKAVERQTYKGDRAVNYSEGRVFRAKSVRGQHYIKNSRSEWVAVHSVTIS